MRTHIVISDGSHSRRVCLEPLGGGRDGYSAYARMPWKRSDVYGHNAEDAIERFLSFARSGGWLAYPYHDYNADVQC